MDEQRQRQQIAEDLAVIFEYLALNGDDHRAMAELMTLEELNTRVRELNHLKDRLSTYVARFNSIPVVFQAERIMRA